VGHRRHVDLARQSTDGFIELSDDGMDIVQFRNYRIAVARPPFADGIGSRPSPIAKTTLDDYEFAADSASGSSNRNAACSSPDPRRREVDVRAGGRGIPERQRLRGQDDGEAAGPAGRSGDHPVRRARRPDGKTADSLLLVRPDYTIYDEVRKTNDFEVFSDMRMAGVGMVGVVHASRAIDALQRLVGRVELRMIPGSSTPWCTSRLARSTPSTT